MVEKSVAECLSYRSAFYSLLALLVALVGGAIALESRFNQTVSRAEFERFTSGQFQPFADHTSRQLSDIRERIIVLEQRGIGNVQIEGDDIAPVQFVIVRVPATEAELKDERIRGEMLRIANQRSNDHGQTER